MYLATCTHPDIAYAVHELTRFMLNYGCKHFDATKHLLRYLKGTCYRGIIYGNLDNSIPTNPTLRCFANADWGSADNRKSVSSYVVFCGGGPIAWLLKQ